ncbi:MAG: diaminopimelate dehydrogenase [Firmicutes bacterium]|nr:diaminopimelate dehydrogenase [Bacillota bacterium]
MEKIRVAIVGMGNVGKGALDAIETAGDMQLAGVVVRDHALTRTRDLLPPAVPVVSHIDNLDRVDVAVLAVPSRNVRSVALPLLETGISTVDSFDIHGQELWQLRQDLKRAAQQGGASAIVGAGWDPGTDSMIRAIFALQAPRGISHTNFGPGMSMGHTVAAKKVPGVRDALSLTLPLGYGQHKRQVYVELEPGYELEQVVPAIQQDPYYCHDETQVLAVDDVQSLMNTSHGVVLERRGVAGKTANQLFRYESRITNPALTGQILVSSARAAKRLPPGAYTLLEVPLAHFLPGSLQTIIEQYV